MAAIFKYSCCNLVGMLCFFLMIFISNSWSAKVTHLPGFDGALPFHLETGYVTVNNESGSEYFYYFVKSERNASEDPLLLWLIGGPYCSGLIGLALNMGPLNFRGDVYNDKIPTLVRNPYSWTKISSIIFLDWPVGTGFSFSRNAESYTTNDLHSSKEIYKFLKEWFRLSPNFLSNPFYVGGDSYGGKLAPLVTKKIVQGNEGQDQPLVINLKGYLVGNGFTVEIIDNNAQVPHAFGLGLIPDELFKMIVESCKGNDYKNPVNLRCAANMKTYNELISGINIQNILAPSCPDYLRPNIKRSIMEESTELLDSSKGFVHNCSNFEPLLANKWANNHLAWEALNVKKGTFEKWLLCDYDHNDKYNYNIKNAVPHHLYLTTAGYRALVYSGDHDLYVPFVGTLEWIRSLNFSVIQGWRSWRAGGQVAGYTISYANNLTFATILGGSHVPSTNMAMQSFSLFERWISHKLL